MMLSQQAETFLASALFDKIHNIGGVDGAGNPCVLDSADLLDGDPSNGEELIMRLNNRLLG